MSILISAASELVTTIDAVGANSAAPDEIVFIPVGEHKIFPQSQKNGVTVNLPADQGEAIVATLNAALQKRMDSTVSPWIDFEHSRKFPASGYPTAFRFDDQRGIMASIDWSRSGRDAVEGRDVRYFSPEFFVNSKGIPTGIPATGPLGGLVTEPAFRNIGKIAASQSQDENHQPLEIMSKLIFASLAINPAADDAETQAVKAIEQLKSEHKEVTASLADTKSKLERIQKDNADILIQAAVADGRIAPKDTETQEEIRNGIIAGNSFALKMLEMLPKGKDVTTKIIAGSGTEQPVVTDFEGRAKQLVTAGQASNLDDALGMVASEDPAAYSTYLATLS